jgi:hypothetical protein
MVEPWLHVPAARFCVMGDIIYYVAMGFERNEAGELVAVDPVEAQSSSQAISRARCARREQSRSYRVLADG